MMADIDFTKVMMDDSTLDVSKEVAMVMSIANTLRDRIMQINIKTLLFR